MSKLSEISLKPWIIFDLFVLCFLLPVNFFYLLIWGVRFKFPFYSFGIPLIRRARGSSIVLGKGVEIRNGTWANVIGIDHRTCLSTRSRGAEIIIGNNVGISGGSIVAAKSIHIGDNVLIGANCLIIDNDFHSINPEGRRYGNTNIGIEPVIIEDNVFIGTKSIILKGSVIGKNSIIGAGSIVSGKIPPNSIAFGNPIRIKSKIRI